LFVWIGGLVQRTIDDMYKIRVHYNCVQLHRVADHFWYCCLWGLLASVTDTS